MVRENDVSDADIWPCSAGVGAAESANRSRSFRIADDWRRAELNRAFCAQTCQSGRVLKVSWVWVQTMVGGGCELLSSGE
jgi:hypothetical protein